LDPESQEENDRLKALLDVDELIKAQADHFERPKPGEIAVVGELYAVAQTESGQLVAVALQFAYIKKGVRDGCWVAFVVDPDDYEVLWAEVETTITEYRNYLENMGGGTN
jgi:hypothetical protein